MIFKDRLTDLQDLLKRKKKISIIPHSNPDGDAIGSTTALKQYLDKLGHQTNVVSPNDFPKFLKWIPEAKSVCIADYERQKAERLILEADVIFLLDFNTLHRAGVLEGVLRKSQSVKVLIDHHQQPDTFDFVFSNTSYPATCQMVYDFILAMGHGKLIDKELASSLYVGIMTDTGNFQFASTSAATLKMAADLVSKGLSIHKIYDRVFNASNESRLKLLSVCLQSMKLIPEFRTVYFHLTREQLQREGFQKGDTEGFVNYGLSLEGYVFSVIFLEDTKEDFVKMSLRSKGDWDVNTFARKHFNGGGHINAAGGRTFDSINDAMQNFEKILPEYESHLKRQIHA